MDFYYEGSPTIRAEGSLQLAHVSAVEAYYTSIPACVLATVLEM